MAGHPPRWRCGGTVLREALADRTWPRTRCELLGALSGALALSGADEASREASDEAISLATSLGQPHLLLDVIHSGLYATVTPENIQNQLALADEASRSPCEKATTSPSSD